jgi:DNA-directed RNA polymerase specialized sigma24 family protein/ParB-like chromosome segregation protein Spo0J
LAADEFNTSGETMRELTRKPLSWFKRGSNIRQKQRSEAESRELGKSLRERQLSPVWAMSDGTLLIGYGRLEAATLEGLASLDVVIIDGAATEVDAVAVQSQENMLRQDLSDFEKVCIVERLRALCPELMAKDLAECLRIDRSTITRLMSESKVIPAAREAFEAGAITLSHVYELSKLGSQQQHELLPVAVNGGSSEAISTEGRRRRNGNGPAIRLNRAKCPLSNATVVASGDGKCPRCSKNEEEEASLTKSLAELWIGGTLKTFILSDEEVTEVRAIIASELPRLMPGFFKSVTVAALIPVLAQRARAFFLAKNVPFSDADDLSSKLSEKIWRNLFGGWPHGNAGAWVSTIRGRLLVDYIRGNSRARKHFGKRKDKALAHVQDESLDERPVNEFMEELRVRSPRVAERLAREADWAKTAAYYQKKIEDAAESVMSLEWGGQTAPLRNKRRSIGDKCQANHRKRDRPDQTQEK